MSSRIGRSVKEKHAVEKIRQPAAKRPCTAALLPLAPVVQDLLAPEPQPEQEADEGAVAFVELQKLVAEAPVAAEDIDAARLESPGSRSRRYNRQNVVDARRLAHGSLRARLLPITTSTRRCRARGELEHELGRFLKVGGHHAEELAARGTDPCVSPRTSRSCASAAAAAKKTTGLEASGATCDSCRPGCRPLRTRPRCCFRIAWRYPALSLPASATSSASDASFL